METIAAKHMRAMAALTRTQRQAIAMWLESAAEVERTKGRAGGNVQDGQCLYAARMLSELALNMEAG